MSNPSPPPLTHVLVPYVSQERLSTYLAECGGDMTAAVALYRWNSAIAAAFWESLGHVEVAIRNTFAARLEERHRRHGSVGTWLDALTRELEPRAADDIVKARERVRRKKKAVTDGQVIAELGFGFWRYLVARRYHTSLWPDLRRGFPHAPDGKRVTVEAPLHRLYEFRNRVAHHERVWNLPLTSLYDDMLALVGFIDPHLASWVESTSRVQGTLALRP